MPGGIDFTMGFNTHGAAHQRDGDAGYRIYILGNFSGLARLPWQQRKISRLDMDNFEQVMSQIQPTLEFESGLSLRFESLEDFHPDNWLEKVGILADLQKLKQELSNPNTAARAAAKIQAYFQVEAQADTAVPVQAEAESQDELLERLLGKKPDTPVGTADSVNKLIDHIVSPHVTKAIEPQHRDLIKLIDSTISQFLRTLLHCPEFQTLEALWRATELLVREEAADQQNFFLVDISQAELLAELGNGSGAFEQKLLQHIQSGDGEQDVLLIGDYGFSGGTNDKELLACCGRLAQACGASFLGGVEQAWVENIIGASEKDENWRQYLKQIQADRVMLAYPRYLLRLPYGANRDPIESLAFEECSAMPLAEELLWGNPAFICARALVRTGQATGADDQFFFGEIPAFSFEQNGEQVLQPGTQVVLSESQANNLLSLGIVPVIGYRQRRGIRVMSLSFLSEVGR